MSEPAYGTWCHVEIPVCDAETAKKFYGGVFGWKFQDTSMDYVLYSTREGGIGGGMMKRQEGMPQQMVNYVLVEDIPATLTSIQEHGGKVVHPETAVENFGWMAWVTDPDGNVFALWKSNPEGHV